MIALKGLFNLYGQVGQSRQISPSDLDVYPALIDSSHERAASKSRGHRGHRSGKTKRYMRGHRRHLSMVNAASLQGRLV